MRDHPPNYETKPSDHHCWDSRSPGPWFNRQASLGPTHADPHTYKPEKFPRPQVERPHLVQWNPRRNVSHHECVFGAAKAELSEPPRSERRPQDRFPSEPARQRNRYRCEYQKDDVHRQDIEQGWPIDEQSGFGNSLLCAGVEVEIEKIVKPWPISTGGNGHRHQKYES